MLSSTKKLVAKKGELYMGNCACNQGGGSGGANCGSGQCKTGKCDTGISKVSEIKKIYNN